MLVAIIVVRRRLANGSPLRSQHIAVASRVGRIEHHPLQAHLIFLEVREIELAPRKRDAISHMTVRIGKMRVLLEDLGHKTPRHEGSLICKGTTRQTRMGIRTDTSWHVSGGARSLANAFRMTKKVGDISRPPSAESTPSLISVLGLRSLRARRRHDDRWGDLALNIDAAARSFRAVQLQEGEPSSVAAGTVQEPAAPR